MAQQVKCAVCHKNFTLENGEDIPQHVRRLTGKSCEGVDFKPIRGVPDPRPKKLPDIPKKKLPDSKEDREISLRWNVGAPGTGRRR